MCAARKQGGYDRASVMASAIMNMMARRIIKEGDYDLFAEIVAYLRQEIHDIERQVTNDLRPPT